MDGWMDGWIQIVCHGRTIVTTSFSAVNRNRSEERVCASTHLEYVGLCLTRDLPVEETLLPLPDAPTEIELESAQPRLY